MLKHRVLRLRQTVQEIVDKEKKPVIFHDLNEAGEMTFCSAWEENCPVLLPCTPCTECDKANSDTVFIVDDIMCNPKGGVCHEKIN